jgi:hypothetical protein
MPHTRHQQSFEKFFSIGVFFGFENSKSGLCERTVFTFKNRSYFMLKFFSIQYEIFPLREAIFLFLDTKTRLLEKGSYFKKLPFLKHSQIFLFAIKNA